MNDILPTLRDESQSKPLKQDAEDLGQDFKIMKRSVVISGHRTSISLENAFWYALKEIAKRNDRTVNQLVSEIDDCRTENLSSAIRVHVLQDSQRR